MDETKSVEIDFVAFFCWILVELYRWTPKNEVEMLLKSIFPDSCRISWFARKFYLYLFITVREVSIYKIFKLCEVRHEKM